MRTFIVTFRVEGEIHNLEFSDNIHNEKVREANAKVWINDYVKNQLGKKGVIFQIISINPVE
ncbi:hypothetical protein GGR21_004164 [Dysgonomonas hofstadii]|uniref:Uncharacterized protein n=1 Tax=Dysgonomonas hofstadii TaxID=637886 RepID=A0A840D0S8_9BACT|nr:hypothetical protein [Dysgonomonas hofstadii]MBB4038232.1 hypothetical protein [Dysgonomonas hofstadii]